MLSKRDNVKDHWFSAYPKSSEKLTFLTPWYAHERAYQVWWCDIKQFLSFPKIRSANLCKPIHYIVNYSTFICPFESGKCGKARKNYKILNISRTKKAFFNEIKNTFYNLWRAIIWWKNKNLTKNSRHKL